MFKLRGMIKRVNKDEDGAALAEYAVLLVICAIVGVTGVTHLSSAVTRAYVSMATWVQTNVVNCIGATTCPAP